MADETRKGTQGEERVAAGPDKHRVAHDEGPDVEGHMQEEGRVASSADTHAAERVAQRQGGDDDGPEVEGHGMRSGPQAARGVRG